MMNAEKKAIREKLEKEGQGPDKRLWGEIFNGVKNLDYMHSRKTLLDICKLSKFKHFRVRFMNLNKRRRIITELYR